MPEFTGPEEPRDQTGEAPRTDPQLLKEQARVLRGFDPAQERALPPVGDPLWKKLVYFSLILISLVGAVTILILEGNRRELILALGKTWGRTAALGGEEFFKLPPPPARPAQVRTLAEGPVTGAGVADAPPVILYSGQAPGSLPQAEAEPAAAPLEKTADVQDAYRLLLEKVEVAARLVGGGLPDYEFQEWRPVQSTPPVFFIEITAVRRTDRALSHFTWEINVERGATRALSVAARELEADS